MKIRGQQSLSRHEQKIIYQLMDRIGKSDLRSKGTATMEKHLSNARTLGKHMAHIGYQNATDFKTRTYKSMMNTLKNEGYSKSRLESMHATCVKLAESMGKHHMIDKSVAKSMGSKDFHRSTEDRVNPQYWASSVQRDKLQSSIDKLDKNYASAARMSKEFGLRKEESLASRELIMKTEDGRMLSTSGSREAGRYRELVNDRAIRYACTENKKDAAFENTYLANMKPGQEYLIVPGRWAKNGRARLVPVLNEEARAVAIAHQQAVRENQACAKEFLKAEHSKAHPDEKLVARLQNVNSVIDPRLTKQQGYDKYGDVLAKAGFSRQDANSASLHADRTEFCQRMREERDENGHQRWTDQERVEAMGHCDDRKLDYYGG